MSVKSIVDKLVEDSSSDDLSGLEFYVGAEDGIPGEEGAEELAFKLSPTKLVFSDSEAGNNSFNDVVSMVDSLDVITSVKNGYGSTLDMYRYNNTRVGVLRDSGYVAIVLTISDAEKLNLDISYS